MIAATRSVLVIDDDPDSLELTRLILLEHGYRVEGASDASEALAQAASFEPHFILLGLDTSSVTASELRTAVPGARLIALSERIPETPEWSDGAIRRERIANLGDFILLLD